VQENLDMFARGPLSPDLVAAVEKLSLQPPEYVITPTIWKPPTS